MAWWRQGGHAYRPCYWHRVGVPGSGGDQWFRADVEYAMCFKRPGPLPWSDNIAMGEPAKYGPGGAMSNRARNGQRRGYAWGGMATSAGRLQNGKKASREKAFSVSSRNPDVIANPSNLISTGSGGGGQLGHELAHESEAPFPEGVPAFFIRSLCPEGGTVLDPFDGSGTSVSVAVRNGRNGIGLDLRRSQAELARRRIIDQLERQERPHKPRRRPVADPEGQNSLFDMEGV
jgi:hypothetical protein